MSYLNVEIKARCNDQSFARQYLVSHGAECKGIDIQTDTYFHVQKGRLKLREGNIENNLIHYDRHNQSGPKNSHFILVKVEDAPGLKQALTKSIGVKVIVVKTREIFYINNVKFHLDQVAGLGEFIEIEAGNILARLEEHELKEQCEFYMNELKIGNADLIEISYSDMLLGVQ